MTDRMGQKGTIDIKGKWWVLRYYVTVMENGQLRKPYRSERLGLVTDFPPKRHKAKGDRLGTPNAIRTKADEFLIGINKQQRELAVMPRLGAFIEERYLPHVQAQKKPSTYKGYKDIYEDHLKSRVEHIWLRDVQPHVVQTWLYDIEANDLTEDGLPLTHTSLAHIKSALSGIFKYAMQMGYHSGPNPVAGCAIPKGRESEETPFYELSEVQRMIALLPDPAATAVAVAGYAGLSKSEIRGLLWEDYTGKEVKVSQAVWQSHIDKPKTAARQDTVPVIPALAKRLNAWHKQCDEPESGLIFPSSTNTPMELNNLLNRSILPVLKVCVHCSKPQTEHDAKSGHAFRLDESRPEWKGWHAFRRGLATNLHDAGVDDLTIQRILRHSDVSVTRRCYVKRLPKQAVKGMAVFQANVAAVEKKAKAAAASARVVSSRVQ